MTKNCTLKEAFIEKQLDKFQPNWRNGEDITAETKQKIKDYVASQMPDELKESASCITDYSIWHMAKKIRKRENLPDPKKSNKGVSVVAPTDSGSRENLPDPKKSNKGVSVVAPTDSGSQKLSSEVIQQVSERKLQTEKVSKCEPCEPKIEEKSSEGLNQKEQVEHKQEHDKHVAACQEPANDFDELVKEIKRLVGLFSMEDVKKALNVVEGVKVS